MTTDNPPTDSHVVALSPSALMRLALLCIGENAVSSLLCACEVCAHSSRLCAGSAQGLADAIAEMVEDPGRSFPPIDDLAADGSYLAAENATLKTERDELMALLGLGVAWPESLPSHAPNGFGYEVLATLKELGLDPHGQHEPLRNIVARVVDSGVCGDAENERLKSELEQNVSAEGLRTRRQLDEELQQADDAARAAGFDAEKVTAAEVIASLRQSLTQKEAEWGDTKTQFDAAFLLIREQCVQAEREFQSERVNLTAARQAKVEVSETNQLLDLELQAERAARGKAVDCVHALEGVAMQALGASSFVTPHCFKILAALQPAPAISKTETTREEGAAFLPTGGSFYAPRDDLWREPPKPDAKGDMCEEEKAT